MGINLKTSVNEEQRSDHIIEFEKYAKDFFRGDYRDLYLKFDDKITLAQMDFSMKYLTGVYLEIANNVQRPPNTSKIWRILKDKGIVDAINYLVIMYGLDKEENIEEKKQKILQNLKGK